MAGIWSLVFLRWLKVREIWEYVIISVIIIGLGWEILEILYKVADFTIYYWLDSLKDMIDDVIGGIFALYFWKILPEPLIKSGQKPEIKDEKTV